LQGMEQWPSMLSVGNASPIRLSMVCFKPPPSSISSGKNRNRVMTATSQARKMLHSSFPSNEDHASIDVAMSVFPTIAIFMFQLPGSTPNSQIKDGHKQTKPRKSQFKSIFNVSGSSVWRSSITTEKRLIPRCCGYPPHPKRPLRTAAMSCGVRWGLQHTFCACS
jgi:hypothetical protein